MTHRASKPFPLSPQLTLKCGNRDLAIFLCRDFNTSRNISTNSIKIGTWKIMIEKPTRRHRGQFCIGGDGEYNDPRTLMYISCFSVFSSHPGQDFGICLRKIVKFKYFFSRSHFAKIRISHKYDRVSQGRKPVCQGPFRAFGPTPHVGPILSWVWSRFFAGGVKI